MNGNTTSKTTVTLLIRNWRVYASRGLAAMLFGVLAFIWRSITLLTLSFSSAGTPWQTASCHSSSQPKRRSAIDASAD